MPSRIIYLSETAYGAYLAIFQTPDWKVWEHLKKVPEASLYGTALSTFQTHMEERLPTRTFSRLEPTLINLKSRKRTIPSLLWFEPHVADFKSQIINLQRYAGSQRK